MSCYSVKEQKEILFSRVFWFPVHISWTLPFQSAPTDFQMAASTSLCLMIFSWMVGPLCSCMWQAYSDKELTPLRTAFNQCLLAVGIWAPQLPFPSHGVNLRLVFYTISQSCLMGFISNLIIHFQWFDNVLLTGCLPFSESFSHSPIHHVPQISQVN